MVRRLKSKKMEVTKMLERAHNWATGCVQRQTVPVIKTGHYELVVYWSDQGLFCEPVQNFLGRKGQYNNIKTAQSDAAPAFTVEVDGQLVATATAISVMVDWWMEQH